MEGRVGSQRPVITSTRTQAVMLCLHWMTETNTITNYSIGLAPYTSLLMSPTGSTNFVVHLHGLKGLEKSQL